MKRALAVSVLLFGLAMGSGALAQTAAKSSAKKAPSAVKGAGKPVALLCQSQARSKYLVVDYGQKTVNGARAVVTDDLVMWTSEETDGLRKRKLVLRHELNRLEGSYRSWPEGEAEAGSATPYVCDKAPAAKF